MWIYPVDTEINFPACKSTMELYKGTFPIKAKAPLEEASDAVDMYLSGLTRNGQIDRNYMVGRLDRVINVTVYASSLTALSNDHLIDYSLKWWNEAKVFLKGIPHWEALSNDSDVSYSDGKDLSFFCLYTDAFNIEPPLRSGPDKHPVPAYLLPIPFVLREDLGHWKELFAEYDLMWIRSGALEMPAYRQTADPDSKLSLYGREICGKIEAATGTPTYYFLAHYYKAKHDKKRPCPVCGKKWRQKKQGTKTILADFNFRCEPCRLVSDFGVSSKRNGV